MDETPGGVLDTKTRNTMNGKRFYWNDTDRQNAHAEGWDLFYTSGSADGPYQVQRLDEEALLNDDTCAWRLVKNGNKPHHAKTLAILKQSNPQEYNRILNVQHDPKTTQKLTANPKP